DQDRRPEQQGHEQKQDKGRTAGHLEEIVPVGQDSAGKLPGQLVGHFIFNRIAFLHGCSSCILWGVAPADQSGVLADQTNVTPNRIEIKKERIKVANNQQVIKV